MLQHNRLFPRKTEFFRHAIEHFYTLHNVSEHLSFKRIAGCDAVCARFDFVQFFHVMQNHACQNKGRVQIRVNLTHALAGHQHPLGVIQEAPQLRVVILLRRRIIQQLFAVIRQHFDAKPAQILIFQLLRDGHDVIIHGLRVFRRSLQEIADFLPVGLGRRADPLDPKLRLSCPFCHQCLHLDDISHLYFIQPRVFLLADIPLFGGDLAAVVSQRNVQILLSVRTGFDRAGLHHEEVHNLHVLLQILHKNFFHISIICLSSVTDILP